ncbi:MAG: hypothetical protein HC921_16665 [Synechococcaceae cyanobacterium SM2_3_1]|nr:hypothetical protein [Synechococcaceae cyanobacterium SM2_3_1]
MTEILVAEGATVTAGTVLAQLGTQILNQTVSAPSFWLPTTALLPGVHGLWLVYILVPTADAGSALYQVVSQDLQILHHQGEAVFPRGHFSPGI